MAAPHRLKFVEPMKAKLAPPPAHDSHWLYEVKFDGFRVLAIKEGRSVELWSRNQKLLNERFPEIAHAVSKLSTARTILDGEVCALDKAGRSSFQLLQNAGEVPARLVYYVFDVLVEGKKDLRDLPLLKRKERLEAILLKAVDPIRPSPSFTQNPARDSQENARGRRGGRDRQANRFGLRNRPALRRAGRRSSFIKVQEFVVAGYTLPQKSRKHFGSLILGYYEGKRLIFAGHVGTGFNQRTLKEIHSRG